MNTSSVDAGRRMCYVKLLYGSVSQGLGTTKIHDIDRRLDFPI